jgi:hypothetical protein
MAYVKGSVIQFLLDQQRTATGALIGGKVYFYNPGTTSTTGIEIWLDEAASSAANNPYTLDANGTAQLYASGKYRIVIKNAAGVTQFDRDNVMFYDFDVPYEKDALQYGAGTFTQATITAALTAIGTTDKVTLLLRPGNWVISSNADWSAFTNVTFKIVPGAILQIDTGTTTLGGPVQSGRYQIFSCVGTGVVVLGRGQTAYSEWFGAVNDGTDQSAKIAVAIASVNHGKLIISNGMMWNYYGVVQTAHPDDVIIQDESGYDYDNSIANSASIRVIFKTSSPGSKNANEYIIASPYHPALVIDNTTPYAGDDPLPQVSLNFREAGSALWQIGSEYYGGHLLFFVKNTAVEPDEPVIEILNVPGNPFAFNTTPTAGIAYAFCDRVAQQMAVQWYSQADQNIIYQTFHGSTELWRIYHIASTGVLQFESRTVPGAIYNFNPSGKLTVGTSAANQAQIGGHVAIATYDFAVHGGTVGTISLSAIVPYPSVVKRAWYEVLTPPTSGGAATISLGISVNDPDGIFGVTAYNDASFNAGFHDGAPNGAAGNFTTKTDGNRVLCIVIAGADLTAGKIKVYAELLVSE